MKAPTYFSLLLWLAVLLFGQNACAQQFTLSNFKIDDSTDPLKIYTTVSTTRDATFTVTATSSNSTQANSGNIQLQLTGSAGQANLSGANVTNTSCSQVFSNGAYVSVCVFTGVLRVDYNTTLSGGYNALRAVYYNGSSVTSASSSINLTVIQNPTAPPAITITNFTIDNKSTVDINATPKAVTYRLTLSKDPGYTDGFYVYVRGLDPNGTTYQVINSATFQAPPQKSGWTKSGSQLVLSVVVSFNLSTSDVGASNTRLIAQAVSYQSYLIGSSTNASVAGYVTLNRLANNPCVSDVFVQNTTSVTGTITAGKSLYAGRAVTTTANGDVVIRSGVTAAFVARESIVFADGFSAVAGATFSAYLDGSVCSAPFAAEDSTYATSATSSGNESSVKSTGNEESRATASTAQVEHSLAAYPNPVQDEMTVSLPEAEGTVRRVVIYDSYGVEVQQSTMPAEQTRLDVRALKSGIYYLQVSWEDQTAKVRFSIER